MNNFTLDALLSALLSYPAMVFFALILIACAALLVFCRRRLSPLTRAALLLLLLLCLAYFALVIWLAIGFGSHSHPPDPLPGS